MEHLKQNLVEAKELLVQVLSDDVLCNVYQAASAKLAQCYKEGGQSFSCGNGGSLCDAMHYAEELTGRFRRDRDPLPAMAVADAAHLSCVANDFGYEHVFARQIHAWGKKGDALLAISTSGESANVIKAVHAAKKKEMIVIGLLGKTGGELKDLCDYPIVVPSSTTERIQEVHIKMIHGFIESIERELFPEHYS